METEKIIKIVYAIIIVCLIMFITDIWKKRRIKKLKNLHQKYMVQLIRLVVVIIGILYAIGVINPKADIHSILLKGSALIVAILGFAAQTALSDIISGLLISFNKPFEVGDRIIVEGQDPGVVEDITLRHTVIRIYDGIRIIVPNSQLNSKIVTNTSYKMTDRRGIHLQFSVSYDTNVSEAIDVIRDCVAESPYTLTVENDGITEDSGPVFFLKFADSALLLDTTIWVPRTANNYVAITDINLRVNNAFNERGIEIPYNYMNVITSELSKDEKIMKVKKEKQAPSKRHYRSNTVKLLPGNIDMDAVIDETKNYALHQRMSEKDTRQLELLAEESIGIMSKMASYSKFSFWIEGSGITYKIHIEMISKVGSKEYKKLLNLSSSGKNEAVDSLAAKIREIVAQGILDVQKDNENGGSYEWTMSENPFNEDEIGESILVALADDIRVSVKGERIGFVVIKKVKA